MAQTIKRNPYLQPWSISADDFPASGFASDQLEHLLGYAVLAPSTHNTQPWLFRINAMDVELFADRRRVLRVVDPDDRELIMSCGAALFNLRVAAEYFGHLYKLELLPEETNPDLLARFQLGLQGETSSENIMLFQAIPKRRTNREPFVDTPVPEALLGALTAAAQEEGAWFQAVEGEEARNAVADLVAEADRLQWADKHFRAELARWVRPSPDEARDGLPVGGFGVKDWLAFAGPALIRTFDRGGGVAARDRDLAVHSPTLAALGTETDDVADWLRAGQALQRVLLTAQSGDISGSFLNQPIEVPEVRLRLAEILGRGGSPQILLRLGSGPQIAPTPRRSVRTVLLRQSGGHAQR